MKEQSRNIAPSAIALFSHRCNSCFMGMIGEYIGSVHTYAKRRKLVMENERVNFG